MCEFQIYIGDLNPEVQIELLGFLGLDRPEDGNLVAFPVASVPKPVDGTEEPDELG